MDRPVCISVSGRYELTEPHGYDGYRNLLYSLIKGRKLKKRHIALVTAIAGASSSVFANPFWFMNTRVTLAKKET